MPSGPLIPGLEEFDAPRRPWPRWIPWAIGLVVAALAFVTVAGFVAGAGPLRALGLQTTELQPVSFRPTTNPQVIQVSVGVPSAGICPGDDLAARAIEDGSIVLIEAEMTQRRDAACGQAGVGSEAKWLDVSLDAPLAERSVVRASDRVALPRATDLG